MLNCEMLLIPPCCKVFEIRLFNEGGSSYASGGGDPYEWSAIAVVGPDGIPEVKLVDKPLSIAGRRALRAAFKNYGYAYYWRTSPNGKRKLLKV